MVEYYILYTILGYLILGLFTLILFHLISKYTDMDVDNSKFKIWIMRIIIIIVCYFMIKCTYNMVNNPRDGLSTFEPVKIEGNNATYRYYNYFQTDSVDTIVHKPIYMKGIVYKEHIEERDKNDIHARINIKSQDGKKDIHDYFYNESIEDLPLNEYKKRVGFKKTFYPDENYELIYFSK